MARALFIAALVFLSLNTLPTHAQEFSLAPITSIPGDTVWLSPGQLNDSCAATLGSTTLAQGVSPEISSEWLLERGAVSELGRSIQALRANRSGGMNYAAAINNKGQVVGALFSSADVPPAGRRWISGKLSALPAPSPTTGFLPVAVNARGVIAGQELSPTVSRPLLFWRGRYRDLSLARFESVSDITDKGILLGALPSSRHAGRAIPAYMLPNGRVRFLDVPQDFLLIGAQEMSENGIIIGSAFFLNGPLRDSGELRGMVWSSPETRADLGKDTIPRAVNDRGFVVGDSVTSVGSRHLSAAFLWDRLHGKRQLDSLLTHSLRGNVHISAAADINNANQILVEVQALEPGGHSGAAILYPSGSTYPCALGR